MNNRRLSDIEIEIMRYAAGGMTGNKTYHQVRDQFMPMDSESMGYANGGGIGSMMKPKKKTLKAVNELQAKAPKGEFLAYINQGEANALKNSGGSGHLVNGIPSFVGSDYGSSGYQGGMRGSSGYQGSKGGDNIADNSGPGVDRSRVSAVQQANHAAAQAAAKAEMERAAKRQEVLSRINPVTGIFSLLNKNPFSFLGSMFSKGFKGLTGKMRGINPVTGKVNTQKEYEAMVADRKTQSRIDRMTDRMLAGKTFSQKNLDAQLGKTDRYGKQFGTNLGNIDNARGSGLRNTLAANNMTKSIPNANITGLNNNDFNGVQNVDRSITSGQIDEFQNQLGGVNLNDYETGNPGQYATADMINEFGDGRMGNINDEFGYSDDFNVGLVNEFGDNRNINMDEFGYGGAYGTSDQGFVNDPYGTSDQGFVNDPYGTSDQGFVNDPYATSDQGFVNDPIGTSDQGFVNDPYATSDQGFQGIGETIAGITNNNLPANDIFAFNAGSPKDTTLKTLDNQVQEGLFMNDANRLQYEQLLQEDLDSGQPLSLPKNRYIT
jgi:hypothetical protein